MATPETTEIPKGPCLEDYPLNVSLSPNSLLNQQFRELARANQALIDSTQCQVDSTNLKAELDLI